MGCTYSAVRTAQSRGNLKTLQVPGLAKRIKQRLDALKVKPSRFAGEKNFTQLSRYLHGSVPSFKTLERLAHELQAPWQWLLVGDECAEDLIAYRERLWKPPSAVPPAAIAPKKKPAARIRPLGKRSAVREHQ